MGQQQLLLIVLSVIVVGIAIVVGVTMFNNNAKASNVDATVNDIMNYASRALQYSMKPEAMGGGGGDFENLTKGLVGIDDADPTASATYDDLAFDLTYDTVTITAHPTEDSSATVTCVVTASTKTFDTSVTYA